MHLLRCVIFLIRGSTKLVPPVSIYPDLLYRTKRAMYLYIFLARGNLLQVKKRMYNMTDSYRV